MTSYLARRLAASVVVVIGITIAGFTILATAPGDPLLARISPQFAANVTPEQLEAMRHELGLDASIPVRYWRWITDVVRGDLGYTIVGGRSVNEEVRARLGPTAILMGSALTIAIGIGVPVGVLAAVRQYKWFDYLASSGAMVAASIPSFLLSIGAIYVFAVWLRWFPAGNLYTPGMEDDLVDRVKHLILPATVLGLALMAPIVRYSRAAYLGVKQSAYMTTARAKGLPSRLILFRHGLRNALIPIITVVALLLPELVAGAVIVEQIFAWPGMGQFAVTAANNRDPASMMSIVVLAGIAVVLSNLAADIGYVLADPRVRIS